MDSTQTVIVNNQRLEVARGKIRGKRILEKTNPYITKEQIKEFKTKTHSALLEVLGNDCEFLEGRFRNKAYNRIKSDAGLKATMAIEKIKKEDYDELMKKVKSSTIDLVRNAKGRIIKELEDKYYDLMAQTNLRVFTEEEANFIANFEDWAEHGRLEFTLKLTRYNTTK